ncbi:hypothetical protein RRG08_032909 [Elysia crispata]|uniref:Uncharacterized protein n=1 Tax=Elysia crispata TaxID=231223 RepID=A0AAE1A8H8_9GAST|nr:hypothetical protein RRG08_032909 [Elysia crispata]
MQSLKHKINPSLRDTRGLKQSTSVTDAMKLKFEKPTPARAGDKSRVPGQLSCPGVQTRAIYRVERPYQMMKFASHPLENAQMLPRFVTSFVYLKHGRRCSSKQPD